MKLPYRYDPAEIEQARLVPSLRDEQVRAFADARDAYLRERPEQAGPGHAIGYRVADPAPYPLAPETDWTETMRYETHLVELDASGGFEGLRGFHYVTLR